MYDRGVAEDAQPAVWWGKRRRIYNLALLLAGLSSAVGCTTHCAGMAPTTSLSGGPPRELLTFARTSPFVGSGYKLVLFDDGCLEYEGWGRVKNPGHADVLVERPAIARVRSSLERLSVLRPDCCNCRGATDLSWIFMTFQVPGGTDTKKIDHYEACAKTPDWLFDVENEIDDALGTERWIGKKVVGKPYHPDRP